MIGQPSLALVFTCELEPGSASALTGGPHSPNSFAATPAAVVKTRIEIPPASKRTAFERERCRCVRMVSVRDALPLKRREDAADTRDEPCAEADIWLIVR